MSQELWEIIIGLAGLIIGWLARHKGIGPAPSPLPWPSPAVPPKPDITLIFALLWELLRSKFPSLPPLSPNQAPSGEHVTALAKAMTETRT
jgi:hypothetical protein